MLDLVSDLNGCVIVVFEFFLCKIFVDNIFVIFK